MSEPVERVDFDPGCGPDGNAGLDDLAISGDLVKMIRIERMDTNHFWGELTMKDGRNLRLSFWVDKRKLLASAEWEGRTRSPNLGTDT